MLTFDAQQKIIKALLKKSQNATCSDCNGKYPCWASLDFGVFICMDCSGAHRALGQSITRVKSIKLDVWHKHWIQNMKIGNTILNKYWEARIEPFQKISASASIDDRKHFVVQKYLKKRFAMQNIDDPLTQYKQRGVVSNYNENNVESNKKPITSSNKQKPQFNKRSQTPTISFKAFGQITAPQKANKPKNKKNQNQNLLGLQDNQNSKKIQPTKKNNIFDQFNFFELGQPAKKQVKIQRSNFNSFSGIKASHSTTGHFDFSQLIEQKNSDKMLFNQPFKNKPALEKNLDNFVTGNFNGFNPNKGYQYESQYNKLQFATISPVTMKDQISSKIPMSMNLEGQKLNLINLNQPNTTHVTMNINMNMYPNIMNINFTGSQNNQPNPVTTEPNICNKDSFNLAATQQNNHITLQLKDLSNPKQNEAKSWVDQWK